MVVSDPSDRIVALVRQGHRALAVRFVSPFQSIAANLIDYGHPSRFGLRSFVNVGNDDLSFREFRSQHRGGAPPSASILVMVAAPAPAPTTTSRF